MLEAPRPDAPEPELLPLPPAPDPPPAPSSAPAALPKPPDLPCGGAPGACGVSDGAEGLLKASSLGMLPQKAVKGLRPPLTPEDGYKESTQPTARL